MKLIIEMLFLPSVNRNFILPARKRRR